MVFLLAITVVHHKETVENRGIDCAPDSADLQTILLLNTFNFADI